VESDVGKLDGRTRAVEEASFRQGERFASLNEALRDLRSEIQQMKQVEEVRREQETEARRADRRALWVGALGIIGTIIVATITVITQAPS
jgi:hypothetical protein